MVLEEGKEARSYQAAGSEFSFTAAIRHVQDVLQGTAEPRSLATETSLRTAQALHDLRESAEQANDASHGCW
ncbi:MAG TPA: hypothetical protein VMV92_22455 [Streptosporangiaceae bacterium]|nr:hypothetical protein [Streptosporangiaceae bacterium]